MIVHYCVKKSLKKINDGPWTVLEEPSASIKSRRRSFLVEQEGFLGTTKGFEDDETYVFLYHFNSKANAEGALKNLSNINIKIVADTTKFGRDRANAAGTEYRSNVSIITLKG